MLWTASSIFGVCWLLLFTPYALLCMYWFWLRRHIQPIKARSPTLVVVGDIVLVIYSTLLCIQRISADSWPCWLNLLSAHIGTIILFDVYLWRCWVLYFTFHLTQQKLANKSVDLLPFFIRNRHYISTRFLLKIAITSAIILFLPAFGVLAQYQDTRTTAGDFPNCNKHWGDALLAVYVGIYVSMFCAFAWRLRSVSENFHIKTELKTTGIIGIFAAIPWILFTQVPVLKEQYNNFIFPFSTLCLIAAIGGVFCSSTVWPLYCSLFESQSVLHTIVGSAGAGHGGSGDLRTLRGILSTVEGVEAFQSFLTKEFSVENILFYRQVEEYRNELRSYDREEYVDTDTEMKLVQTAKQLYAKFVQNDAPFQVNLPSHIVRDIEISIANEFDAAIATAKAAAAAAAAAAASGGGGAKDGHHGGKDGNVVVSNEWGKTKGFRKKRKGRSDGTGASEGGGGTGGMGLGSSGPSSPSFPVRHPLLQHDQNLHHNHTGGPGSSPMEPSLYPCVDAPLLSITLESSADARTNATPQRRSLSGSRNGPHGLDNTSTHTQIAPPCDASTAHLLSPGHQPAGGACVGLDVNTAHIGNGLSVSIGISAPVSPVSRSSGPGMSIPLVAPSTPMLVPPQHTHTQLHAADGLGLGLVSGGSVASLFPVSSPSSSPASFLPMSPPSPLYPALSASCAPLSSSPSFGGGASGVYGVDHRSGWLPPDIPTLFDAAAKNIYNLMDTDSCPRFLRSEQYKQLIATINANTHKASVLQEMKII